MCKLIPKKSSAILVIVAFTISLFISPLASAKYVDRSDELDFGDDNSTTYIIIGAAVAAAVIVYFIVKKKGDDKDDESNEGEESSALLNDWSKPTASIDFIGAQSRPENEEKPSNFGYYVGFQGSSEDFNREKVAPDFSDMTLEVGVSFGF